MNSTVARYKANKQCLRCTKIDERTLSGKSHCYECNEKIRIYNRKYRIQHEKCIVQSWVPVEDGIYPNDCKDVILVTYSDGMVNTLEKSWKEDWLDVFDGVIAWRDLPLPYKEKTA